MLHLFAAAGVLVAKHAGSLAIAGAGILNGLMGKNNTEKSRQLAVHQQTEIAVREKERLEIQAKIEYTRLMCQKMQHQESLSFQEEQRGIDRTAQADLAKSNRDFQEKESALNRRIQRAQHQENLAVQQEQREIDRQLQVDLADLSREFTKNENVLNRELQVRLVELTQSAQAQQAEISRTFAEKIEVFKADLQKYLFDKQRELQLELKNCDVALGNCANSIEPQRSVSSKNKSVKTSHQFGW
jgi:hypothetical protein